MARRVAKILYLLVALLLLFWSQPSPLYFVRDSLSWGQVVSGTLLFAFVLFNGGIAWVNSAIPRSIAPETLEENVPKAIDYDDDERKEYLDERRLLVQAGQNSANQFDKAVIALSAGALGLSIVFVREIASPPTKETLGLLSYAWISFGVSLLSILLSFLLSQQALRRQSEILEKEYHNELNMVQTTNWPGRITRYLNWTSMFAFMIGVVFFAMFSIRNLLK